MRYCAVIFLVIAMLAGLFGFGFVASAAVIAMLAGLFGFGFVASAAGIAKILFFVFLVFFVVALIACASRGRW